MYARFKLLGKALPLVIATLTSAAIVSASSRTLHHKHNSEQDDASDAEARNAENPLQFTVAAEHGEVQISLTAVPEEADHVAIIRMNTLNDQGTTETLLDPSKADWTDRSVEIGKIYWYKAVGINPDGDVLPTFPQMVFISGDAEEDIQESKTPAAAPTHTVIIEGPRVQNSTENAPQTTVVESPDEGSPMDSGQSFSDSGEGMGSAIGAIPGWMQSPFQGFFSGGQHGPWNNGNNQGNNQNGQNFGPSSGSNSGMTSPNGMTSSNQGINPNQQGINKNQTNPGPATTLNKTGLTDIKTAVDINLQTQKNNVNMDQSALDSANNNVAKLKGVAAAAGPPAQKAAAASQLPAAQQLAAALDSQLKKDTDTRDDTQKSSLELKDALNGKATQAENDDINAKFESSNMSLSGSGNSPRLGKRSAQQTVTWNNKPLSGTNTGVSTSAKWGGSTGNKQMSSTATGSTALNAGGKTAPESVAAKPFAAWSKGTNAWHKGTKWAGKNPNNSSMGDVSNNHYVGKWGKALRTNRENAESLGKRSMGDVAMNHNSDKWAKGQRTNIRMDTANLNSVQNKMAQEHHLSHQQGSNRSDFLNPTNQESDVKASHRTSRATANEYGDMNQTQSSSHHYSNRSNSENSGNQYRANHTDYSNNSRSDGNSRNQTQNSSYRTNQTQPTFNSFPANQPYRRF